ncbi:hypothetical protein JR316_0010634 [Psilocybe cubensis]|uniref:Uncharacterized protein n=1 Tax=Psilocybe cubensis TaxID=181762 RepID=A0ACB8GNZ5_PSICU|nr:hypothetical protein JR316_0010634 [Psilocybe cubensis]KAH9476720.1 hypothetical protein JR316_0010634 [Psilocybe cubensis]
MDSFTNFTFEFLETGAGHQDQNDSASVSRPSFLDSDERAEPDDCMEDLTYINTNIQHIDTALPTESYVQ